VPNTDGSGLVLWPVLVYSRDMTTRIYLDVDGVLNAFPAANDKVMVTEWPLFESTYVEVGFNSYKITIARGLIEALGNLSARDDVEIVWLTTWREAAVNALCPAFDIPGTNWTVVTDGEPVEGYQRRFSDYSWWWKAQAMATHLDANPVDQVVWLDDDQPVFTDAVNFIVNRYGDTDFLLIAPITEYGLTKQDIKKITAFTDGVDIEWESVV